MDELLQKKAEAFNKHLFHVEEMQKHEAKARKWRLVQLDLNEEIRELERGLSEPVKVIYGRG